MSNNHKIPSRHVPVRSLETILINCSDIHDPRTNGYYREKKLRKLLIKNNIYSWLDNVITKPSILSTSADYPETRCCWRGQ